MGQPLSCPQGARLLRGDQPGCVFSTSKVLIPSGSVLIGPTDWDSVSVVAKQEIAVRSFYLDDAEVQVSRYLACAERKACEELPHASELEPGVPVTDLSAEAAERFCRSEGGRLPSAAEWLFAAAGREARRFPWGAHGLVCRRASYGLAKGPCAEGGRGPELTKARPSGQTPVGVFDLVGNVAEWTKNPDGQVSIHGGSFASTVASELKSWSETASQEGPEVGFRCAYDVVQNP